jgi:hypothetical protein
MASIHRGSCLCGQIRYEVVGDFENFILCHCKYCQKDTGSAYASNLFSSTATLKWLAGRDKIKEFILPATRHARSFCSSCGAAVPSQQLKGTLLVVPAGSLDSEVTLKPRAHIFVSSRAGWEHDLEAIPSYEKLPG